MSDSYDQLADFAVYKFTAEENYCSNFEVLQSIPPNLYNAFNSAHSRIFADENVELIVLARTGLHGKYYQISK